MDKENINFTFVNLSAGALYRAKAYTTIKNVKGNESQADVLLGKYNFTNFRTSQNELAGVLM